MTALHDDHGAPVGPHGPLAGSQADAVQRRSGSLIVSANAGSGKTTVLVERYIHALLVDGVAPSQILAITFTDKAAGELRSRIRSRLVELGARDQLRSLDHGWISTFHATCTRILRAHAVQTGIDPGFVVLDGSESRELQSAAFEESLADLLDTGDLETLDVAAAYGVDRLGAMVAGLYGELRSRGHRAPRLPGLSIDPPPVPDPKPVATDAAAALDALKGESGKTVDKARGSLVATLELLAGLAPGETPSLKAFAATVYKPGSTKVLADGAPAAARASHAEYLNACHEISEHRVRVVLDALLVGYHAAYEAGKARRGGLDYEDLQIRARDLLRDSASVRQRYARRFKQVMVDEFQDTNQLQLELLDLLGEHRFVVGDTLQSIYGFRHADVEIFRSERAARAEQSDAVAISENYRTRPEILVGLDLAFGAGHGEDHVPFSPQRSVGPGEPLIELLLVDREAAGAWPTDDQDPLAAAHWRRAEARLLAGRISELLSTGTNPNEVVVLLRSLTAMHVYESALEEAGIRTLAAAGRGYWGRTHVLDLCEYLGLLANPEDELALFGVLASPLVGLSSDGLAILAQETRSGSRWDALRAGTDGAEVGSLLELLSSADQRRLASFVPWCLAERSAAARRSLSELLGRVIERMGYDLYVLGLTGGERRWANVRKLLRLADEFEARHGRNARAFVDRALAEVDAGDRESDAPVADTDGTAVRLMSIHAAKGLEFPVVVVADIGHQRVADSSELIATGSETAVRLRTVDGYNAKSERMEQLRSFRRDADLAEERRIFHVGMTRAEERLILSGPVAATLDKQAPSGWILDGLVPGLESLLQAQPDGDLALTLAAAGQPDAPEIAVRICREPIVRRVSQISTPSSTVVSVQPADSAPTQPGREVDAGRPIPVPPARNSVAATVSYSSLASFDRCAYRFHLQRECGLPDNGSDPLLEQIAAASEKKAVDPLLRGSLVHLALERIDLRGRGLPDRVALAAMAAEMTDALLPEEGFKQVERLIAAAVGAPIMEQVWSATHVAREQQFAVSVAGDEAPLLYGVMDLVAEVGGDKTVIVDYKTDAVRQGDVLADRVERAYRLQRASYGLAALSAGAGEVDVIHLYLERPSEPVIATFTQGDLEGLRSLVHERCRVLAQPERPVAARPGRFICAGCPARGGLCSYGDEETSR